MTSDSDEARMLGDRYEIGDVIGQYVRSVGDCNAAFARRCQINGVEPNAETSD